MTRKERSVIAPTRADAMMWPGTVKRRSHRTGSASSSDGSEVRMERPPSAIASRS